MIRVIDDYVIQPDNMDYTLSIERKDKQGNTVYKAIGYYGTLEAAVEGCRKDMIRRKLSARTYTLTEAVIVIKDVTKRFVSTLHNLVG